MLFSLKILDEAFVKVCQRQKEYSSNNGILCRGIVLKNEARWDLRHNWNSWKAEIIEKLNSGTYKFVAVKEISIDGELLEIWSAEDAVVIEALTLLLKENGITESCTSYHLKGKGGVKAAVDKVRRNYRKYKFVMKTDVKKYYASVNHDRLFEIGTVLGFRY